MINKEMAEKISKALERKNKADERGQKIISNLNHDNEIMIMQNHKLGLSMVSSVFSGNGLGGAGFSEIAKIGEVVGMYQNVACQVYGDIKNNLRSNENKNYEPSSPYSASKAAADHLVSSYVRTYKINAVISNCCNNYGPYQFPEKLIPKMIVNIFNNKELPIYARGNNSREWIHVNDHCEALLTLYLKGKSGENYNVGSGKNLRNIDLVKKILKVCKDLRINIGKKSKIKFVKDRPGHDFRYALNSKKISKHLKWKTKVSFNQGIKDTIKWYLENKTFLKSISKKQHEKRFGLNI